MHQNYIHGDVTGSRMEGAPCSVLVITQVVLWKLLIEGAELID